MTRKLTRLQSIVTGGAFALTGILGAPVAAMAAAKQFYKGLVEVDGWESMPLTKAAQKVQVSAFPNHYAKHEAQAGDMIAALHGTGPFADLAASLR